MWILRNFHSYLLIVFLSLCGCATIVDPSPTIRVRTVPEGADIYYRGEKVGVTPALIKVKPQHHEAVTVRYRGHSEDIHLDGHYRWWRSFTGNLVLLSLAPVGWVTDLSTGHAWAFRSDYNIRLTAPQGSVGEPATHFKAKIAIAPPQFAHANLADEVAHSLEEKLAKDYPNCEIIPYQKTFSIFDDHGIDFDSAIGEDDRNSLYFDLKVDKIYFSKLRVNDDDTTVRGEISDIMHPNESARRDYIIQNAQLKTASKVGWVADSQSIFYWLPNTVSLDLGQTSTNFKINGKDTQAKAQGPPGPFGEFVSVISAVSLRRVTPPIDRDRWSFRLTFVPTLSLSYANEKFKDIAAIDSQTFHRFHTDAGWGPSLNYGARSWNFYFNLLPVLAYDQISTTVSSNSYSENTTHGALVEEFGVLHFFNDSWIGRIYFRSAEVPKHLWEHILGQSLQTNATLDAVSVNSAGISVGYILPNDFLHRRKKN